VLLATVRVVDEPAVHNAGGSRNVGQRAGDGPAGARFGGRDLQAPRAGEREEALGGGRSAHGAPHGSRIVAVAMAAMPSRRPMKPSFSLVVAFTPTRSIEMPAISAIRARMASRCGPIFGASHTMVRSRCTTRP